MFIAGIEIFFGFIAGGLILAFVSIAAVIAYHIAAGIIRKVTQEIKDARAGLLIAGLALWLIVAFGLVITVHMP